MLVSHGVRSDTSEGEFFPAMVEMEQVKDDRQAPVEKAASPVLPPIPLVSAVTVAPPTESVADAWPVTLPAVADANVIVHCPFESVFAPASSQVLAAASRTEFAPFESLSVKSTCSSCAGTNVPVPGSFSSVTTNVCGSPTSFVASGAIEILAAAHFLVASSLSPAFPSAVWRWSVRPPTLTSVLALTTVVASPLLAGLGFFLLGAGPILWVISTTTLRQSVTPPRLLGRVSPINIMSYGARPLGSALGAIVGGFYGAEVCLYLAAAIFGAQALVILLSPAVGLLRQPDMVSDGAKALRTC